MSFPGSGKRWGGLHTVAPDTIGDRLFMLSFLQNDLSGRPSGPPHPARKKVKKGIDILLILC